MGNREMNKEDIKALALTLGFKLKPQSDGSMDLNPYVYQFALALRAAATTPPAPEVESVESIGKMSQYQDQRGRWWECPAVDLELYAERGDCTRTLFIYVDQPKLYTHPANDGLRKAAEEAIKVLEFNGEQDCADNLRAELNKGKSC